MFRRPTRIAFSVLLAAVAVGAGVLLTHALALTTCPLSLFVLAVLASAWYGGRLAGVAAAVLSLAALDLFFAAPGQDGWHATLSEGLRSAALVLPALFAGQLRAEHRRTRAGFDTLAQERGKERAHLLDRERAIRAEAEATARINARLCDELQEAARRKDEFLAALAHELRNPLAPLRNGLMVLRLTGADPASVEQVRAMMERQIGQMTHLIEDLLDVSRLLRGKIRLRPQPLDLARLARSAAEDHQPQAGSSAPLEVETPPGPVCVMGDETRLAQVLSNLLDNAVKFTGREGRITVQVTIDEQHNQAVLTIRDTGMGIAVDVLPRLFQPFTQADRSLDRAPGGLGLGLALVRGLVELHGGTVEARSEGPGRGAEFVVRLPRSEEPQPLEGPRSGILSRITREPGERPHHQTRVLVVEDNPDGAESLRLLLDLLGHEVRVERNGLDGVKTAVEWRPEVVLCDIGLPGLDGYGVARALRQNPATKAARLIAITGYGRDEDRRRSLEAGFDHHLTKPAPTATLRALLAGA